MPTPHNRAKKGEFAKTVLFPGDPLRAKYCAENFFENPRLVTDVRNVLGYTGTYKGVPVSVMSSGMGGPSAGIYSYELFTEYDVDNIIRIGTSGGLQKDIPVGALILAMTCSTDQNWAMQYNLHGTLAPCADYRLFSTAADI
ncbi:MAG: purine-nucleoside phosphorylase, partial [Spirochaetales bacterium]|nr:purine-nucleoside phosphorylase [Candidatus Physcosoma equi]